MRGDWTNDPCRELRCGEPDEYPADMPFGYGDEWSLFIDDGNYELEVKITEISDKITIALSDDDGRRIRSLLVRAEQMGVKATPPNGGMWPHPGEPTERGE